MKTKINKKIPSNLDTRTRQTTCPGCQRSPFGSDVIVVVIEWYSRLVLRDEVAVFGGGVQGTGGNEGGVRWSLDTSSRARRSLA